MISGDVMFHDPTSPFDADALIIADEPTLSVEAVVLIVPPLPD